MKTRNVPTPSRAVSIAATVLVATLAASGLTACGSEEPPPPAPSVTVTPDAQPTKTAVPEPEVALVWPLTGMPVKQVEEQPAVAVKIENTAAARPQFGLEQADVVWETIVEFDVSRFIAVYQSSYPTEVGPVRSVRPMDIPIAAPLNGVFVYSGGQPGILRNLRAEGMIQDLDETSGSSAMWRSPQRRAPHNLHANIEKFAALAKGSHSAAPKEQFAFAPSLEEASAVADGKAATNIVLSLSAAAKPQWVWDAEKKVWLRSEGASPALVASGAQISATNVVTITAKHYDSGFKAQNNAPVPTYDLEGSGEAMIASGGKTIKAKWSKKDQQSPMVLLDDKGETLTLAPGNTWIELVPKGAGVISVS